MISYFPIMVLGWVMAEAQDGPGLKNIISFWKGKNQEQRERWGEDAGFGTAPASPSAADFGTRDTDRRGPPPETSAAPDDGIKNVTYLT